jgi:prophage maintenance system killer protein
MTFEGSSEIAIYQPIDGSIDLEVRIDNESMWLTRHQLAVLYGRDVKTIGKHIANARREELSGTPVVAKFATTAADGKKYNTEHYNLDVVLSVGYRVKSPEGVRFRTWANDVIRHHLERKYKGRAEASEQQLAEIGAIINVLSRSTEVHVAGVAEVLNGYLPGLTLLRDFDDGHIAIRPETVPAWKLTIEEARDVIRQIQTAFPQDRLLGHERGEMLEGIIAAIYQQFGGVDLYPTVEEKAAHLLYFVVKDHPLTDGNKRCGAALFIAFLDHNNALLDRDGNPRISNSALATITLLVAMSQANEKQLITALIMRMTSGVSE